MINQLSKYFVPSGFLIVVEKPLYSIFLTPVSILAECPSVAELFLKMLTCLCVCASSDIYCCGLLSTRKSDCTGLPQNMLVCGSTPAQRGQSRVMMKGSMSLISWYNKGHFRFLTNSYSPTKQGTRCSGTPRTKTPQVFGL